MNNILNLFNCIFFGEFGLLTMVPRYLFTILLPTMIILNLITHFLPKLGGIPVILSGLGCTTAALTLLTSEDGERTKSYFTYLLVFIIPCSAQLSLIVTFASVVCFNFFIAFLLLALITAAAGFAIISIIYESQTITATSSKVKPPISLIKDAFSFVIKAAPTFSVGSLLVSFFSFFGVFDYFSITLENFFIDFLGLPRQAANIFILNILKRDFGSASLLAMEKYFSVDQLIEIMLMLTFSVPCFNSLVLLIRIKKLPRALLLCLGSFVLSIFLGKLFRCIYVACFL